ncbi:MAG: hypothetical protein WBI53_04355 [Paludibacter sp.]
MNLLNSPDQINQLHRLIQLQETGTPKQLAERLGINRAELYLCIEELISFNLPLAYSFRRKTFYYKDEYNQVSCENIKPQKSNKFIQKSYIQNWQFKRDTIAMMFAL